MTSPSPRSRRALRLALPIAAAAIAIGVVVWRRAHPPAPQARDAGAIAPRGLDSAGRPLDVKSPILSIDDPSDDIKSADRIGYYVRRGASVSRGGPGQLLHPGDAIQLTYSAASKTYFAALSVDGAKRAKIHYPSGGVAALVEPGHDVPLRQIEILDATVGDEAIFGVFCDSPIALEPVRAAFAADPTTPPIPAGCRADRVAFIKAP